MIHVTVERDEKLTVVTVLHDGPSYLTLRCDIGPLLIIPPDHYFTVIIEDDTCCPEDF